MRMFYFQGLFRNHPSFWNAVSVCNYLVHCCSSGRTAAIVSSRCLLLSFIISFFTYSIFSVNTIKKEKQGNCNENSGRKSIWGYSQNPMFLFICIMRNLQDCILVILLGRYNRESILLAIFDAGLKAAEKKHLIKRRNKHSLSFHLPVRLEGPWRKLQGGWRDLRLAWTELDFWNWYNLFHKKTNRDTECNDEIHP